MKIKSFLTVIACGVASQFMTGCGSTGKYYDFSTPTTTYHKAKAETKPVNAIVSEEATEVTAAVMKPQTEASAPVLEANASTATRSAARPVHTAPLTTPAVEKAVAQSSSKLTSLSEELAAAKTKKDIKAVTKKITREAKAAKASGLGSLNYYVKMGLILLIAGALVAAIGLGFIGSVVAIVGLVLILLGILEM